MKISFWIPAIVFYAVSACFSNPVQVGTVLFTTTDLIKKCWTESDKSLLKARLIMQDVLPDPDCIDFSKPDAVVVLLEYFHTCFHIISVSSYGKIQNLMYLALSDALGGYLRSIVLPFTRRAYYGGQLKYSEAKNLFKLYDDIKTFLKTNGVGWAKPQKVSLRNFHPKPLVITGGNPDACRQLIIIEKEGRLHCINPSCVLESEAPADLYLDKNLKEKFREEDSENSFENSKLKSFHNSSRRVPKKTGESNYTSSLEESGNLLENFVKVMSNDNKEEGEEANISRRCRSESNQAKCRTATSTRVIVPLPLLDDCSNPHSIAVPFRKRPFRNLNSRLSAFVLEYYYIAVIKCFIAKGNTRTDIKNFNAEFHSWLESQVCPHLTDETWYPGFGGVLRVMETIKKYGMEHLVNDPLLHDKSYLFGPGVEFEVAESPQGNGKPRHVNEAIDDDGFYSKRFVVTVIIFASLFWLFAFFTCAFYYQATRGCPLLCENPQNSDESSKPPDGLVNLHFIASFFKKKLKKTEKSSEGTSVLWGQLKPENAEAHQCVQCPVQVNFDPGKMARSGQGDLPPLELHRMEIPFAGRLSTWECHRSLISFDEKSFLEPAFERKDKVQKKKQRSEVHTLWKKPSTKRKRNTAIKGKTKYRRTEKPSSTCICSDSCVRSRTSTPTSRTRLQEKLSSATMEFFEKIIKHKTRRKPPLTQQTTEESESEEEAFSTSETEY